MASMIVSASEFVPSQHMLYTKPKANSVGGKSVGILNTLSRKALYLNTPLMMTWGANGYDNQNGKSYDISLQFPREEFSNQSIQQLLKVMVDFENKIKLDAQTNSRDWFGKASMSKDVIDALFSPMLKYPKNQSTGEPDTTRPPTLKVKLPIWAGEYKFDLFDTENNKLLPSETSETPETLIQKGSDIACIIICGGIWFANGMFGVTWKLYQGVVKPVQTLSKGMCHIKLDDSTPTKVDKTLTEPTYDSDGESPSLSNSVVDLLPPPMKRSTSVPTECETYDSDGSTSKSLDMSKSLELLPPPPANVARQSSDPDNEPPPKIKVSKKKSNV